MRELRFYGVGEDLVRCEGTRIEDDEPGEVVSPDGVVVLDVRTRRGEGLAVAVVYDGAMNECWMVGLAQLAEHRPFPEWPVWFEAAHGYSAAVVVEAPDDARVRQVSGGDAP